jgi:hypothetical protein
MDKFLTLHALLAQAAEIEAEAPSEIPDFRNWVWIAYAAVLFFLTIFTLYTLIQVKGAQRRMEHLEERLNKHEASGVKVE